jgi:hypothetical protein
MILNIDDGFNDMVRPVVEFPFRPIRFFPESGTAGADIAGWKIGRRKNSRGCKSISTNSELFWQIG